MKIQFLDGEKLYYAFFYGKREVLKKRKHLNKINVFPVADGDTGTNLVLTMQSIVDGAKVNPYVSNVSHGMAQAAIMGSRGNSGIIFAQFVHGVSEAVRGKKVLSLKEFAYAMKNGVEHAYKALSKPVEGTILTVMKAWANALHAFHDKASDYVELMHHSLAAAKTALKETPKKLKVLQKAGVVDAGAEGFVHFLEGAARFFRHGKKPDLTEDALPVLEVEEDLEKTGGVLEYRYCTEALMKSGGVDRKSIRSLLASMGDSLIVAGDEHTFKVHIHTNTPQDVFYTLRKCGTYVEQKVDDMKRQYEDQYGRKASIALVTDSTCDLPQEIIDRHQIHVIPLNIHFGETRYLDRVALTPAQFYTMLDDEQEYPTTSQPAVKVFKDMYEHLLRTYDSIVSVHLSGALSGTVDAARLAAKDVNGSKISVIDSKHLSSALGLIVQGVAEEIAEGRSHDEVVRVAEALPGKTHILVSVDTLRYMVRGGRVSPLKGFLAKMLNLKPIISLDEGASTFLGKAFSSRGCLQKILRIIETHHREIPIRRFTIGHAHTEEKALKLEETVARLLGQKAEFRINIAPVIGVHAGIGALSVVYLTE